jgi:hypothetical protein
MKRSFHTLGFALTTALVLAGCSSTTDAGNQSEGPNGSDSDGGASGSSEAGTSSPTPDGGAPTASLSFVPANLPSDISLAVNGDWIFNTKTCTSTKVTIDTVKGTVSCLGQAKGAFAFTTITQADTSQGTLTAGLFVTRKLVIEPGMEVDVIGNRPLVIVALDSVLIQGTLRAAGRAGLANGGGFDGVDQGSGSGPGAGQVKVGHVGAGGAGHCGAGGDGTAGGKAYGTPMNTPLIGGSSGGHGRYRESGAGGGAVQLVAGMSIELGGTGVLDVAGGGSGSDGGGAGSGGAVLLEAPAVSILGVLAANGGGGGAGYGGFGINGAASVLSAKGGTASGSPRSDNGGDGAAGTTIDGQAGMQLDATSDQGGGGGAAGRIRINTASGSATLGSTAVISPALTTPCTTQGTPAKH